MFPLLNRPRTVALDSVAPFAQLVFGLIYVSAPGDIGQILHGSRGDHDSKAPRSDPGPCLDVEAEAERAAAKPREDEAAFQSPEISDVVIAESLYAPDGGLLAAIAATPREPNHHEAYPCRPKG